MSPFSGNCFLYSVFRPSGVLWNRVKGIIISGKQGTKANFRETGEQKAIFKNRGHNLFWRGRVGLGEKPIYARG